MDKTNKTYNWNELKDLLPEHHPKDSIWDSINESLDASIVEAAVDEAAVDEIPVNDLPNAKYNFNDLKNELPLHEPAPSLWENISENLDSPAPIIDFDKLKEDLPAHEPVASLWENISKNLDKPVPNFDFNQLKGDLPTHVPNENVWENILGSLDKPTATFNFQDYKNELNDYAPSEGLWDKIESGLEVSKTIDQLPSHNPPENLWDKIEDELEEVQTGISIIRKAILIGLSMLFVIGAAVMLNQDEGGDAHIEEMESAQPIMFASNEIIKVDWSDDEDVRLIQEMCQDYMAVCTQPEFKKLESELLELNDHKKELLDMVSDFDEESSYGPMLAKIENQKTALMKEMISMI